MNAQKPLPIRRFSGILLVVALGCTPGGGSGPAGGAGGNGAGAEDGVGEALLTGVAEA